MHYKFCTLFDKNYLPRGIALYNSLRKNVKEFTLWIVCFDSYTYNILNKMKLKDVIPVSLDEFEDEELKEIKKTRTPVEYCWTCSPSVPYYILRKYQDIDMITYIDADLLFFDSVDEIFKEFKDKSIMITEHRYDKYSSKMKETSGIYNVQFMTFKRDEYGIKCLEWWRDRCNEWCYNRAEDGKFGDQKYLDDWTKRFENVCVVQNKGAGLAPWNLQNYKYVINNDKVYVDGDKLIFYHFHNFKIYNYAEFEIASDFEIKNELIIKYVYDKYIEALKEAFDEIKKYDSTFQIGIGENKKANIVLNPAQRMYYSLMEKWIDNIHCNKRIDKYLSNKGIKNICIYGIGSIGKRLYCEIKASSYVKVQCFIDNNYKEAFFEDIPVYSLHNISKKLNVDLIVITPVYDIDNILMILESNNVKYRALSFKELIDIM